jgi:hypothetical protein
MALSTTVTGNRLIPPSRETVRNSGLGSGGKDEPPPWGKAAAGGRMFRTGVRTCCLTGSEEGGNLFRGRDPGEDRVGLHAHGADPRGGWLTLGEGSPSWPGTDPRFAWGKLVADERKLKQSPCQCEISSRPANPDSI